MKKVAAVITLLFFTAVLVVVWYLSKNESVTDHVIEEDDIVEQEIPQYLR
jgi:hypothetical protein